MVNDFAVKFSICVRSVCILCHIKHSAADIIEMNALNRVLSQDRFLLIIHDERIIKFHQHANRKNNNFAINLMRILWYMNISVFISVLINHLIKACLICGVRLCDECSEDASTLRCMHTAPIVNLC